MAANDQIKLIQENAEWIRDQRNDSTFPLSYEEYSREMEQNEKEAEKFDKISEYKSNLTYESMPYEKDLFTVDTVLAEKRQRWHENLTSDLYMEEAVNVLEDMKMNNIKKSEVAQIKN